MDFCAAPVSLARDRHIGDDDEKGLEVSSFSLHLFFVLQTLLEHKKTRGRVRGFPLILVVSCLVGALGCSLASARRKRLARPVPFQQQIGSLWLWLFEHFTWVRLLRNKR